MSSHFARPTLPQKPPPLCRKLPPPPGVIPPDVWRTLRIAVHWIDVDPPPFLTNTIASFPITWTPALGAYLGQSAPTRPFCTAFVQARSPGLPWQAWVRWYYPTLYIRLLVGDTDKDLRALTGQARIPTWAIKPPSVAVYAQLCP